MYLHASTQACVWALFYWIGLSVLCSILYVRTANPYNHSNYHLLKDKHTRYSISVINVHVFPQTSLPEPSTLLPSSPPPWSESMWEVSSASLIYFPALVEHSLAALWEKVVGGKLLRIAFPDIHLIDSFAGYRILGGNQFFSSEAFKASWSPLWQIIFPPNSQSSMSSPTCVSRTLLLSIKTERWFLTPLSPEAFATISTNCMTFQAQSQRMIKFLPGSASGLWALETSVHVSRKSWPRGEATCGCPSW